VGAILVGASISGKKIGIFLGFERTIVSINAGDSHDRGYHRGHYFADRRWRNLLGNSAVAAVDSVAATVRQDHQCVDDSDSGAGCDLRDLDIAWQRRFSSSMAARPVRSDIVVAIGVFILLLLFIAVLSLIGYDRWEPY